MKDKIQEIRKLQEKNNKIEQEKKEIKDIRKYKKKIFRNKFELLLMKIGLK